MQAREARAPNSWLRSVLFVVGTILFLGAVSTIVMAVLDRDPRRTSAPPVPPAAGEAAEINAPGSGRVFILFIDSWRHQAVTDPALMPGVPALREKGVFAEVETVHDAITVPAIRAAFTGHDHFQVLGFVRNFMSAAPGIQSLFSQMKARGDRLTIYSDKKTFHQFGTDTAGIKSFETEEAITGENQVKQAREVFQQFCEGEDRAAIYHVVFLDYMAHATGVRHPLYGAVSRLSNDLITDLAAALPANDTLIVFGDHGHDDNGRHVVGLDIPTAFLALGPGFRKGVDLGRIHITAYRYLVGWALKLPLAHDYPAARYPEALEPAPGPVPAGYFEKSGGNETKQQRSGRHPPLLYVSLILGVTAAAAAWLVGRNALGSSGRTGSFHLTLLALGAVLALVAWGAALAHLRPLVHEPEYETLRNIWIVALVFLLILHWRFGPATAGWIGLAVPFLLLWPTTYRYGAPPALVPAWVCWATGTFLWSLRGGGRWHAVSAVACFAGIALFLQPYIFAEAFTFEFTHWIPLSYTLRPYSPTGIAVLGAVAALVILFPRPFHWLKLLMAASFAAYVACVFRTLAPSSVLHIAVALGSFVAALLLKWHARRISQPPPTEVVHCYVAGLFAAFFYSVRLGPEMYLFALLTTAALRLSALLVRHLPSGVRDARSHAVLLIVFGAISSIWATTGWGMRKLEWGFLYDYVPAGIVENQVGFFLPLIALKLCLPALIARAVVLLEMRDVPMPAEGAAFVAGVKILALLALGIGIHLAAPGSDLYMEAVQQIAFVLIVAATFLPARATMHSAVPEERLVT